MMLLLDKYGEALPLLGAGHPEGLKIELLVSAQCPVDPATALPEGREDLLSEAQLLWKAHQFTQSIGNAPVGQTVRCNQE